MIFSNSRFIRSGYLTTKSGKNAPGIGSILPDGAVAVEALGDPEPDPLFMEEEAVIANACMSRQMEFARTRTCARKALSSLKQKFIATPIPRGDKHEPIWPSGIIGSITHCHQYCCAAVTTTKRWSSIGIDAEIIQKLSFGVTKKISSKTERSHLSQLAPPIHWEPVLFSAKEAIFKAWYPQTHRWLGFHDVEVRFDTNNGEFEARLLIPPPKVKASPLYTIRGRFLIDECRVLTIAAF